MASDEEKIAALKAIRDKARASRQGMAEDGAFAVCDQDDDDLFRPAREMRHDDDFYSEDEDYDDPEYEDDEPPYREDEFDDADNYDDDSVPCDDNDADFYDEDDETFPPDDEEEEITSENDDDLPLPPDDDDDGEPDPWRAVFRDPEDDLPILNIEFNGKNLENGEFDHEDLSNANFSAANLSGVNFSGSDLRGADFSGANLTDTNLSGADLTGAIFAGAQLIGTNFTGAIMNNVVLTDVYFQDAILLDITIDDISLEELQELVEYLAQYYPHKLNLTKINLTMLDLRKIDLSKVSLRGVDFTGVDFTGVNIAELDLSECIITPEQIAQALGRVPTAMELKKILAPKKKARKGGKGIDFTDFFLNDARNFGVYNVSGFKGMDVQNLVKLGQKAFKRKEKAPVKDEEALEHIRQQNKANKEELRNVIEERKRRVLEAKRRQKEMPEMFNGRDRGGYQR